MRSDVGDYPESWAMVDPSILGFGRSVPVCFVEDFKVYCSFCINASSLTM